MQDILGESLRRIKKSRERRTRMLTILLVLSFVVSLDVFWVLRQPGLTLAGDADCKIVEHGHDDACQTPCPHEEHTHSIDCYSDDAADVETQLDWQKMFADYPYTGNLQKDLAGIAKMQVGYTESAQNFEVGSDGIRRGYTRYGAWYGIPYGDWSALFVSFCLHYAHADASEYPINTGANSMAEKWKMLGKFAQEHEPTSGDLVFFADNTVGIVSEVQNSTVYVIRGNIENAVCAEFIAKTDPSIVGWGLTGKIEPPQEEPSTEEPSTEEPSTEEPSTEEPSTEEPTEEQEQEEQIEHEPTAEELLDISNGPAFFIFVNETVPQRGKAPLRATARATDLIAYLQANEGNYFFTLLDLDNQELPKDAAGNYIAVAQQGYKLTLGITSPHGFHPGTYEYQIPNGLMVDGGEGTFVLQNGTNVGSWVVTDTGLITIHFNDNMNIHSDVTISATMGMHFAAQDEPIDFDGKITVIVQEPPPKLDPTELLKWGRQGDAAKGEDPTKLYWSVKVTGHADSEILGNILADHIIDGQWSKRHRYTESDIANGLTFVAAETNPAGGEPVWHSWKVTSDDPHLIWTETQWSYKIPHTVVCDWCGEIDLDNDGWEYTVNYTSTPNPLGHAGTAGYENKATIDGQEFYGWTDFAHGDATGIVVKTGSYIANAEGGAFVWQIDATIPPREEGKKADYNWYIMDNMSLRNEEGAYAGRINNAANLATVTATIGDVTVPVPRVQDATDNDMYAWHNSWSASENGINYGQEIRLLHRCQCNADNCRYWNGSCGKYWFLEDDGVTWSSNGFCQCWTTEELVTLTLTYKTDELTLLQEYGGMGYQLLNVAELRYTPESADQETKASDSDVKVVIPGIFKKELTHSFDGYTANYRVTVNESKLVISDGSPLLIHDVMTDTLAFINGSLIITAEDIDGNVTELHQDVDYTITYDGTGLQTDDSGKKVHVLEILILHPQPVMYILDYDATLIMPEVVTGGIKYTNYATVTLWGEEIAASSDEKVYADINIAAKTYKVEIQKVDMVTGEPLSGATFGLYNAHGGLVASATTQAGGKVLFQTNIVQGIVLREHILYYLQETHAPNGYRLDDTKHWFCFCDNANTNCGVCDALAAGIDIVRIPLEQIGTVHAGNEPLYYDLPATGGSGTQNLILVSAIFVITPLVYGLIQRRKRERGRVD